MPVKVDPQAEPAPSRLELWFACPHCGAPSSADEEDNTVTCDHCKSPLLVARPQPGASGGPVAGIAECVVRGDDELRRVYIERRLSEERARLCSRPSRQDGGAGLAGVAGHALGHVVGGPIGGVVAGAVLSGMLGEPPALGGGEPLLLEQMLAAERERLEGCVRVGDRRLLMAPYAQVRALIVQCVFGRDKSGGKVLTVRARPAEQSTPAFDAQRWNMRDRGLRVGTARMKLLSPQDAASGAIFLPLAPAVRAERGDIDRAARKAPPDVDRLHARNEVISPREFIVYRPVWLAQFLEGRRETWLLVEAGTSIIAGVVSEARELEALLSERGEDPCQRLPPTRVVLAASRCVECGQDLPHERGPWMRACPRCRTGLAVTPAGLERVTYDHARPAAGAPPLGPAAARELAGMRWMPCWSYRFALRLRSGQVIASLDALLEALGAPAPARTMSGERVHVPALRLLGLPRGVAAFDEVCQWLHRARIEPEPGVIPPSEAGAAAGCDLTETDARPLARAVLFALLEPGAIARLTALIVREKLDESELAVSDPRLVMARLD